MKTFRYLAVAAVALMATSESKAQDKVEGSAGIDIVSQYIWRGQDLGNVSVQPGLGISWKGLSLSAWGSVGLTSASDTKEIDLTLGYSVGGFNVGIIQTGLASALAARSVDVLSSLGFFSAQIVS